MNTTAQENVARCAPIQQNYNPPAKHEPNGPPPSPAEIHAALYGAKERARLEVEVPDEG